MENYIAKFVLNQMKDRDKIIAHGKGYTTHNTNGVLIVLQDRVVFYTSRWFNEGSVQEMLPINKISSIDLSWYHQRCLITVFPRRNPIRLPLNPIRVILLDKVEAEGIAGAIQSLLDASETEDWDEGAKGEDLVAPLAKLADLHERGVLSDQEFRQAKKELKHYHMFRHPTLSSYEVVKKGWSWPGFLGGVWVFGIWAFTKKLWVPGAVILVFSVVIYGIHNSLPDDSLPQNIVGFVMMAASIAVGVMGNKWRINDLRRRGYEDLGIVAAKTPDKALGAFLAGKKEDAPAGLT